MNFFDFYHQHSLLVTILIVLSLFVVVFIIQKLFKFLKNKKVRTGLFEIAPDSVKTPETDDMHKTRVLLMRQLEYVDHYVDGLSGVFLALEKDIIEDAMSVLFQNKNTPKTHMMTCLINSDTGELLQKLKNYLNGLLIKNHIGDNKEKIKKYAKAHVCQVVSITKKHSSSIYRQLCGKICIDTLPYWKNIGIADPEGWAEKCLIELLIGISELRYSDFGEDEDNQTEN